MTNVFQFVDMKKDIPCKIAITQYYGGEALEPSIHYRIDPTDNYGWLGWITINPLDVYAGLNKDKIKRTLIKQGWYKKLYCSDEGDIVYEIEVTIQEEL